MPPWLLLATVLGAPSGVEEIGGPRLVPVGDQRSVPDGVVTALAADPRGFLWIGTTQGLVRFDGYDFRRFVSDERDPGRGPGGNLVRALHVGQDGRLWIGFDRSVVSVLDPEDGRFTTYRLGPLEDPRFAGASAMALAEGGRGRMLVALRGAGIGIVEERPEGPRVRVIRRARGAEAPAPEDLAHAVAAGPDGTVWIGADAGLLTLDGEDRLALAWTVRDEGKPDPVYSLLWTGTRLWAGTLNGRLLYREGGRVVVVEEPSPETAGLRDTIYRLLALPEAGELWVARATGLERRALADGRLLRRIRPEPGRAAGLRAPDLRALARDGTGLIWIGGFGGGVQWHDPEGAWLAVLDRLEGGGVTLERPNIGAILVRADGQVLLGLRGQGLVLLDPQLRAVAHWDGREGGRPRPWHWVTALAEDAEGVVYVGTRDGLFRWRPAEGAPQPLVAAGEAAMGRYVRRLYAAADGRIWAGTGNGAFWLERDGPALRVERVAVADAAALGGEVNAFAEEEDGTIWIGAAAGLFRGRPGAPFARIPLAGSFPVVVGLLRDPSGTLWIDTNEGLFRRRPDGVIETLAEEFGLTRTAFGANLLADRRGRIWSHRHVLDASAGRAEPLPFDLELDFGTGWFRAYAALPDGRLLFGGSRGVLVVDPEGHRPPPPLPRPVLTEVLIAGQETAVSSPLALPPGARSLSLRFASPDVRRAPRLAYRFRLRGGSEEEWTEVDAAQRLAAYRSLPPGEYRFEVAAGDRGRWSEPLEIAVTVLPRWWERTGAWVVAVTGLALALVLAWRLRSRALHARAAALEQRVAERTAELAAARDRAERAVAELRQAQDQLIRTEKMASLGRMVAGLAHEINTPLGIALTAASRLEEIQRQRFAELAAGRMRRSELEAWQAESGEGTRLIRGSLERAARLVASLKRVSVDQIAERRRRFPLAEFLEELRMTFDPRLKRSPHRLRIEAEAGLELDSYPGALFQVLSNLIENAERHAFPEGRSGTVTIRATRGEGVVRLTVEDDGVGMSPEVAARAFEPFFTTRREDGGSGLGLHLVYTLVTGVLGGTVELETEAGRGSRFRLLLPETAPAASSGASGG